MEYDVVVVGGGPAGLSTAIRIKQLAAERGQDVSVVVLEKGSEPGAHILSGAIMDPKALTELHPRLERKRRPAEPAGHRRRLQLPERALGLSRAQHAAAAVCAQPRQLHRQPGRGHQAGWASRPKPGRGNLPRLCRRRSALQRRRFRQGRGHRQHGRRQGRRAHRQLPARHGAAGQIHRLCRRRARPPGQTAHRQVPAGRRARPAELWHRHQGTVGNRPQAPPARLCDAHRRLAHGEATPTAAPSCTTWRATRWPWASSPAWATPTPT
jgi:hypothetical protein